MRGLGRSAAVLREVLLSPRWALARVPRPLFLTTCSLHPFGICRPGWARWNRRPKPRALHMVKVSKNRNVVYFGDPPPNARIPRAPRAPPTRAPAFARVAQRTPQSAPLQPAKTRRRKLRRVWRWPGQKIYSLPTPKGRHPVGFELRITSLKSDLV